MRTEKKRVMKRQNLGQVVGEELLSLIRSGEWIPGDKLPSEQLLMKRFGVGRNALREGIHGLIRIGVLDVRPGVGTTVLSIEGSEVLDKETVASLLGMGVLDELYDLRLLLEGEAAEKAAERATSAELAEILKHQHLYESAVEHGTPTYEHDIAFHRAIVQASGNSIYPVILELTADRLVSSRKATDSVPSAVALAKEQHAEIYSAIAAGDALLARQLIQEHIRAGRAALNEWILREKQQAKTNSKKHS
jgi:GntR family transcriptional repressor for pyruvate dehydrogenase complex